MNTFAKSLAAIAALSLPGVAIAQSTDAEYCKALSVSYLTYVRNAIGGQNLAKPPLEVQYAMTECQAGNTAAAIPVLEEKLRAAKVSLPSREPAKADANCGAETWSTEKMMYVGTPCPGTGPQTAPPPATW